MEAGIASILPALIVFDFDYTLMPFSLDRDIAWPCKKVNGSVIIDKWNDVIYYYPDVLVIFEKLNNFGIKIGVTSRTKFTGGFFQLINLFCWDKYISFQEAYFAVKSLHLENILTKSKIPPDKIIFFDAEDINVVQVAYNLGIFSVFVRHGITLEILDNALREYELTRR